LPRRKLSEERRAHILEAAVAVIGERGLCDTRISDIAARSGASSALVIYYFQSKDRLLGEALAFSDAQFYEQTAGELAKLKTSTEQLVRLIELSCALGKEAGKDVLDEWLLWLDLWARAPRDRDVAKDREALDRRWRDAIAEIVRAGQKSGEFGPVDAEDFALRLGAMIDGLAIQVVLGDPLVNAARMFEICFRLAYDDLGFHGPAAKRVSLEVRRRKRAGGAASKQVKALKPAAKAPR
jgi:AcrR family transcriptional regulator